MSIMDIIATMVPFLGKACGENCEVALVDLRDNKGRIIAIANEHISGRSLGSPLTDLGMKLVSQGIWKTQDYVLNYAGKTRDNRMLHSSVFFIKQEGALLGMLSVNVDTSRYVELSEDILRLVGLTSLAPQRVSDGSGENFYNNMEEIIQGTLAELGLTDTPKEQYTQEERLTIIERLMDHGVFLLRGSVSAAAEKLNCSEPSLYRYIGVINRRKAHGEKN